MGRWERQQEEEIEYMSERVGWGWGGGARVIIVKEEALDQPLQSGLGT